MSAREKEKKNHISFDGDLSNSVFVTLGAKPLIICVPTGDLKDIVSSGEV